MAAIGGSGDCTCQSRRVSALNPDDLGWLDQHGWRPTVFDEVCREAVNRLIGWELRG